MQRLPSVRWITAAALLLALGGSDTASANDSVLPGFDLFVTAPGTEYDFSPLGGMLGSLGNLEFTGQPLGTFDFGGGPVAVGATDTIIERLETATTGDPTIQIQIVALQLQSTAPIDIGNGPEFIFVDLNADQGDSEMTINGLATETSPHGQFDSSLHFTFDVSGSTTGFIGTVEKTFTSSGTDWDHDPVSSGVPILSGVNFQLNTTDTSNDFWPPEVVIEDDGNGQHVTPTLSEWGQILFWLLLMAAGARFVAARRAVSASGNGALPGS